MTPKGPAHSILPLNRHARQRGTSTPQEGTEGAVAIVIVRKQETRDLTAYSVPTVIPAKAGIQRACERRGRACSSLVGPKGPSGTGVCGVCCYAATRGLDPCFRRGDGEARADGSGSCDGTQPTSRLRNPPPVHASPHGIGRRMPSALLTRRTASPFQALRQSSVEVLRISWPSREKLGLTRRSRGPA